ncbi:hypothetical protein JEU11_07635 [Paraglaciecola chathamensis]|uniref:Uncharacterized protein n=1 Tax=Paraglaciecola chathamensis TaxID=368405 RepID=A0ABS0WCW9_9ALTE|nr:hypothetical protein [Paraglaciecola chathamensis]MBJ2136316.1 hypothetical protein [Paraglaciecola chathamensis]
MSSNIFKRGDYGRYYYFKQLIELHNDTLNIEAEHAKYIIKTDDKKRLSLVELEFYKTYVHESIHFLDSTTTIWGIEYTVRLFNCLKNNNSSQFVDAFLLNDAEIEQHTSLNSTTAETKVFTYRTMRSILSYDKQHGVHILFKYYDVDDQGFSEVLSTPISMLALLEGHAFASENLEALLVLNSSDDRVSAAFLEREYERVLSDARLTEYTCLLAFTEQLFEKFSFEEKLITVIHTCRLALDLPVLFPFPESYIDACFKNADAVLVSSLKMELGRGMNRSSLVGLILIILSSVIESIPIGLEENFELALEDRLFEMFRRDGDTLAECKKNFWLYRDLEYEFGCELLREKGAELAYMSAKLNKDRVWSNFDLDKLVLPDVLLSTGEFVSSKNRIDYDMESYFYSGDDTSEELDLIIKNIKTKKPHLRPAVYHDWLQRIKAGETGVRFYPDDN